MSTTAGARPVRRSEVRLADGRPLLYYGDLPARPQDYQDQRDLPDVRAEAQIRWDRLLGEWVIIAGHRQDRTFQPAGSQCPLCPSTPRYRTEIPAPQYEVVVFENRFPALRARDQATRPAGAGPDSAPASEQPLLTGQPAGGRCEVICFSQRHDASFADLSPAQAGIVMSAWADRSAALASLPDVRQVYCFENRGAEVGVTLSHPHGQIYAYPYVAPRTDQMLRSGERYRLQAGRNLFDDLVAAEAADQARIVLRGEHWIAFVPFAARWPYEVHLYPLRRVPDLPSLDAPARAEFCELYLDLLGRFDRLFGAPAPYVAAWHQAPLVVGRDDFALHLELFTIRRAPGRLKYQAGSESGMGAFANDVVPEVAAARLRLLG